MSEKVEELYQEYLREKLNLIFETIEPYFQIDEHFLEVKNFENGFSLVHDYNNFNLKNFIDTEGKLISNTWYDNAKQFHEGFACVEKSGKWNFINTKGELISDTWYDWVYDFEEGFARVKKSGKWNFINTKGNLMSDIWYDYVYNC